MSLLKTNEIQNYNGSSLTLTASTVSTSAQLNTGGNISVTGSLNVSDDSTTRTNLGLGSIATQDSDNVTVTGGTATLGALTVSGSDSGDLVRITQTGTGNALVVEDSANPDSTPFVVDASGNLLVGTTSTGVASGGSGTSGININAIGAIEVARSANPVMFVNRTTSDGDIMQFCKDGTTVGSIHTTGGKTFLQAKYSAQVGLLNIAGTTNVEFDGNNFYPNPDNTIDLGAGVVRWDDVYATNGTIQTSDRNEKQDIEELSEAEQRVAVACKGLMRKFRWKSAVAKKGNEARMHFGIIAQDLQDAFAAEGLDAGRYGIFISNTWWETSETYTDDEGIEQTRTNTYDTAEGAPEGAVKRTRLGVRYPELLAFIIAVI